MLFDVSGETLFTGDRFRRAIRWTVDGKSHDQLFQGTSSYSLPWFRLGKAGCCLLVTALL